MADYGFHPFADLFPMLDDEALAELAADIKAESQREPIFLWQDKIIDGRNRYRACKLAGVEPVLKRIEFPGGEREALAYVVSRNLKRRHLTIPQRSVIAAKVAGLKRGNPQFGPRPESGKAQAQVANMLDVSVASVGRAKAVIDLALKLLPAVEAGKIGLRAAADMARHPDEQSESATPTESENPEAQLARMSANAKANAAKALKADARYRQKDIRAVFRRLSEAERSRFLADVISVDDVIAWRMSALNSQRRQIADAYFNAITSVSERLNHDEVVRAWIEEHERGDAVEG